MTLEKGQDKSYENHLLSISKNLRHKSESQLNLLNNRRVK